MELTPIYLPEDLPTDPDEEPDPELAIAEGFEITRQQEATLEDGTVVTWQERLLIIRSKALNKVKDKALAEVKTQALDERLDKAEAEILALTPSPGRGKRQFNEPVALQQALDDILTRYKVADFFDVELERQVTTRRVRGYKGRPTRTEEKVRYQVHMTRREEAIERAKQRLGWHCPVRSVQGGCTPPTLR